MQGSLATCLRCDEAVNKQVKKGLLLRLSEKNCLKSVNIGLSAFSALTLLVGGRKGIRRVKTEWWDVGVVICLERSADLHMAQLIPLPLTVLSLIHI